MYDVVVHGFLPALSIVIATLGGWMLSMRNNMLSVLGEDYIRLATAKGLSSRKVMLRYAARNALLPSITGFGMALGFILGVFVDGDCLQLPGYGLFADQAVRTQDYPLMQGIFLVDYLRRSGGEPAC